ncbi:MAG TPA: response regulator [Solirubrobacteraceae bacterium]
MGDANSGEEGVEQAARPAPDLVLMDVRMPGIGGIEAARRIAARSEPSIGGPGDGRGHHRRSGPRDGGRGPAQAAIQLCSLRQVWQDHERRRG